MATYYSHENLAKFEEIGKEVPELAKKFFEYYGAVFAQGELAEREKAGTLKAIFENSNAQLPVQKIHTLDKKLIWLLDRESASLLAGEMIHEKS